MYTLILFSQDAKLGKKCTLLDLSRRPSVVDSQEAAEDEAKDEDSSCSPPKPVTDHVSMEDSEPSEVVPEDNKEGLDEKEKSKSVELPVDESPTKMEVDASDSPSDDGQSMTECNLASNIVQLHVQLSLVTIKVFEHIHVNTIYIFFFFT